VSLAIAAVILIGTWSLFRQSLHLLFDGVPDSVDPVAVRALLAALPGVTRVHDLHIWATGTSHVTLTAHLVMPQGSPGDAFLKDATEKLHDGFEITHVTLQVVQAPFMRACDESAGDGDHV
jgi:cobalt-zinc-cadmium efflux system protein